MAEHGDVDFFMIAAIPAEGTLHSAEVASAQKRSETKKKPVRPPAADRGQTEFTTHDQESLPFGRDMRMVRLEEHLRRCLDSSGSRNLNAAFLSHAAATFHVTEGDVMRVYERLTAPAVSAKQ